MFSYVKLTRLLYRKLLTLLLLLYFLMLGLFFINLDSRGSPSKADTSSSDVFDHTLHVGKDSPAEVTYVPSLPLKHIFTNIKSKLNTMKGILGVQSDYRLPKNIENKVSFTDPIPLIVPKLDVPLIGPKLDVSLMGLNLDVPLMGPKLDVSLMGPNLDVPLMGPKLDVPLIGPKLDAQARKVDAGDFVDVGEETYVYSAFLDDRKVPTFVRIITLMSQKASQQSIYCHFNDTTAAGPVKSDHYELCENHDTFFGGYIFSCRVPTIINIRYLKFIVISLHAFGSKVVLPLLPVRPSDQKLAMLDLYPRSLNETRITSYETGKNKVPLTRSTPAFTNSNITKESPLVKPLSFAICVSPLFGNISVHRLIEFVELSRLLGAQHFIFYNYSVADQISDVLQYYMSKRVASVLPWTLPVDVTDVWYHGQLLANNDCLYRTMPHFDLVSFNDIDEFIVPHSSTQTWKETFSSMLTEDRCGLSFQSAFYKPDIKQRREKSLNTPVLTARTRYFSQVRTKVMVCPWRVFEVGIHHISKQNREDWRPLHVQPSVAYLHHYRRCISDYGTNCGDWVTDTIIADRYLTSLRVNFQAALKSVFLQRTTGI